MTQSRKRGRPVGSARKVAEGTGVNLRTVQRALKAKVLKTPEEIQLARFLETLRNFATFCRDNPVSDVGMLPVSETQMVKLRGWLSVVRPWLDGLAEDPLA